ncbi:hypothetical protein AB0M28_32260 [Streptomyces sp. NPDC051940]|uniref:hypothetical protein n=1 Tax=Streptomyces sp. NPDC051940 TaxID=3155675 RepID=UPI0034222DD5
MTGSTSGHARGTMAGAVVLCTVALAAAGCGEPDAERPSLTGGGVSVGASGPQGYDGPLWTEMAEDGPDSDPKVLGGAATRALECDGPPYFGGNDVGDGWGSPAGGRSAEEGLRRFLGEAYNAVPTSGYRVEKEEGGRTLFAVGDAEGRTKAAVIVAKDRPKRAGWGMETFAVCDPAELPAKYDAEMGVQVWTDAKGARVPVASVRGRLGNDHCDWQDVLFLTLGEGERGAEAPQYVRDEHGKLDEGMVNGPFDPDAELPADARDTGFRRDGGELWLAADGKSAYVRSADGVERWPGTPHPVACR